MNSHFSNTHITALPLLIFSRACREQPLSLYEFFLAGFIDPSLNPLGVQRITCFDYLCSPVRHAVIERRCGAATSLSHRGRRIHSVPATVCEMDGTCRAHFVVRKAFKFQPGNLTGLVKVGKIILKLILMFGGVDCIKLTQVMAQ
jgi:hypothetical protein